MRVVRGPRENRARPAVDPLFRSAARAYGTRVVGVVLTGALNDGTAGLLAIKRRGGIAVVQDPQDAAFPGMPESACEFVTVDARVPLREIAPLLSEIAREPASEEGGEPVPPEMDFETEAAEMEDSTQGERDHPTGVISSFTCPECGGPLWEIQDGELVRFRCRVGHAYTGETALESKSEEFEDALWSALNTLEESAQMARRLSENSTRRGHRLIAERFTERARATMRQAELIRSVLQALPADNALSHDEHPDDGHDGEDGGDGD